MATWTLLFCLTTRSSNGNSTVSARLVLAAHGKHSPLDRMLNRSRFPQSPVFVGLKAHFQGPSLSQHIELHAFTGGYCGLSEIENNRTNACLIVRQDVFQQITAQATTPIDTFIQWMQHQNPALSAWFAHATPVSDHWHSISGVSFIRKPVIENDALMVGDSAGMIPPLTGNGMAMALEAGKMAAFLANHFLAGHLTAADLKQQYRQQWRQQFQTRLLLGQFLQRFALQPHLLSPGLHLFNAMPKPFIVHTP
ncbi:MAG TPA: hypothetical protein VHO69_03860, partial [Phototrophicaceae bacterium]|nr:hypothetical protein [Phototrophicaceae bacterium]